MATSRREAVDEAGPVGRYVGGRVSGGGAGVWLGRFVRMIRTLCTVAVVVAGAGAWLGRFVRMIRTLCTVAVGGGVAGVWLWRCGQADFADDPDSADEDADEPLSEAPEELSDDPEPLSDDPEPLSDDPEPLSDDPDESLSADLDASLERSEDPERLVA